jgi:hypothetical protein
MVPRLRTSVELLSVLALSSACTGAGSDCELPAAEGAHRRVDTTVEFTLPDSGGFLANGQLIAREQVGVLVQDLFAQRPPATRAVFVWRPARARCADVAFLAAEAQRAGGAAYDAAASRRLGPEARDEPTAR